MMKQLAPLLCDFISVSEKTAMAAHVWVGKNNEMAADKAAVDVMRAMFNEIPFSGNIVIGEGERDNAPMLYIGEKVGTYRDNISHDTIQCDIAVDPLECTTICAYGAAGAMTTMVIGEKGTILSAPDIYMNKIAVANRAACEGIIDLDFPVADNIKNLAKIKKCDVSDITIAVLNRSRHQTIISEIITTGARVKLVSDGDVAAAIMTCIPNSGIDMYVGIGGAPEGVIAAAAVDMLGGHMQCRLHFNNDYQMQHTKNFFQTRSYNVMLDNKYNASEVININSINRKNTINEHAGELIFIATGVTDGPLLKGIHFDANSSMVFAQSLCIYRDIYGQVHNRKIDYRLHTDSKNYYMYNNK